VEAMARQLVAEHPAYTGVPWEDVPAAVKLLATQAASQKTGSYQATRDFLTTLDGIAIGRNRDKAAWDGKGTCPTCGAGSHTTVTGAAAVRVLELAAKNGAEMYAAAQAAHERGEPVSWTLARAPVGGVIGLVVSNLVWVQQGISADEL
jgi:hypothetical protein